MSKTYYRGEMYYTDLNPAVGSEQNGYRPVLIVQNNTGNRHSPTVIVAPITSRAGVRAKQPTHYYIAGGNGLILPSVILLEQLRTIDKIRIQGYIGKLDKRQIHGVNHALAISVGLVEPHQNKLVLCLCTACVNNFYDTDSYILRRVYGEDANKDICTYCNVRQGFDYEVIKKPSGKKGGL